MARRQAIDPDELFETANRMVAEGKEVTANSLLDALGGGSLRTIYKYLDQWKERRPVVSTAKPTEMPEHVRASFAASWRAAQQEAALEVEAVKAKAAEEVEAAVKQFQDTLEVVDRMEKEAVECAEELETMRPTVARLTEEVSQLSTERASLQATVEQLKHQLEKTETAASKDREERDVAIKEASELKGLSRALKEQNEALLAKLSSGEKEHSKKG